MSRRPNKLRGLLALLSGVLAAGSALAQAQWQPTKPVTLIVPYAAGGGTDANARAIAQRLSELWKQPVLVENVPGADGLMGTRRVIDAKPDGYTLLMQVPSLLLNKYVPALKGVDPMAGLAPVSSVAASPAAIVVGAKVPAKTLAELVRYCKTAGVKCSAASGENISKLTARKFAADFGIDNLVVASYRGTAPIVSDLIGDNVTMAFTGLTAALPHHKAGTLRVLVTEGETRPRVLPDVPTSAEAGFGDFRSVTWYGLFAPRATPANVTEAIARMVKEAGQDARVQQAMSAAAADPVLSSPAQFAAQIRREDAYFGALAKRFPFDE